MKTAIDKRDANYENDLRGGGVTAQKIVLVISRFGPTLCSVLLKLSEIILTFPHKNLRRDLQ